MRIPAWSTVAGRDEWRDAVLSRYGRVCHLQLDGCTTTATTADHLVPRSTDLTLQLVVDNGRPACLSCNRRRRNRPLPRVDVVVDRLGILTVDRLGILS